VAGMNDSRYLIADVGLSGSMTKWVGGGGGGTMGGGAGGYGVV